VTKAQTLFAIALALVAALILFFAAYVVSSTFWADRWVRRRR
jgi:hypothetical protein